MLHLCKSRFLLLKSKKLFAPTFEAESKKRPHPTEEVTAFPIGEGVGIADGRGHRPSGRVSRSRRKRSPPSPLGKVSRSRRKRSPPSPLGKVSAQPTKEVTAFPLGEGVGVADGRGHRLKIRADHTNQTNFIR